MEENNKNRVHITRNSSRKKGEAFDVPIMEVFKKLEQMTTSGKCEESDSELPDTLKMTMEHADSNGPIDFHCEAVKKDDGSVQYECRFVRENNTSVAQWDNQCFF